MKKEHFIIASYLTLVCIFTLVFISRSSSARHILSQSFINRQNVSEAFIRENILASTGEEDTSASTYIFNNVESPIPIKSDTYAAYKPKKVLGASVGPKKIIVDLSKQRVYAYEGNQMVLNFLVSTGKYGATPVGNYKIWYKVRSQTMKGGSKELGTYYYLPNVQFVQFFNKAIGFHSTYWHNNFGTPMSHGCVNMTLTDSETLYHWASPSMPDKVRIFRSSTDNPGTPVEVVQSWKI